MNYTLNYNRIFSKKDKVLTGYEVVLMEGSANCGEWETLEVSGSEEEFIKVQRLLRIHQDTVDNVCFIEQHPLTLIRRVKGKKEIPQRNPHWEQEIRGWKVDMKGQRV